MKTTDVDDSDLQQLVAELFQLRERLREAEETLQAIRQGEVDALVMEGRLGPQVYTLKGAEHPYRRIIEEMSEGAATLLRGGTILYCNRRLAEMLRVPLHKIIGSSLFSYMSAADHEAFEQLLDSAMTERAELPGPGANSLELAAHEDLADVARAELQLLVRPVGDGPEAGQGASLPVVTVPAYVSVTSLEVDETRTICLVVTDLTEQKRNEELVEAGKRKLAEEQLRANKLESIGLLAGGLAHDLNNTLTAIMGNIVLAGRVASDTPVVQRLAEAESACRQARDVTQQLLTFSRGGAPIRKTSTIGPLLRQWATFAMSGSNVACDFRVDSDLWPADIDEGQISRVINNLVINAQQAMPEGGILTIRAENMELSAAQIDAAGLPLQPGRYVRIAVEDQGTGISEGHLPRIFDPYFTTKQKGSGLGLSIVYSVVKSHGGHVTVESELGVGSTFFIYLPAAQGEVSESRPFGPAPHTRHLSVLIMDDQESIRNVIGQMLVELEGHEVTYARDGTEALELYGRRKARGLSYDLVLMDLTIARGMGGKEAISKLLEIDPDVRAIVISGYSNDPVMSRYSQYGFKGVLRKPFDLEELIAEVHRVVDGD